MFQLYEFFGEAQEVGVTAFLLGGDALVSDHINPESFDEREQRLGIVQRVVGAQQEEVGVEVVFYIGKLHVQECLQGLVVQLFVVIIIGQIVRVGIFALVCGDVIFVGVQKVLRPVVLFEAAAQRSHIFVIPLGEDAVFEQQAA